MQYFEHRFVAMGGPCRLRLYANREEVALSAIAVAEAEVQRLERKYSRYLPGSLTSRINRAAGSDTAEPIDVETAGLLKYADTLWRESDGLFDLTSGVLRRAWDFRSGRVPVQDDLDKLLPLVGWQRVRWDQSSIVLPERGMELDFGGCVKEYGSDSAALTLLRCGVKHALVDLSGDIAAVGARIDGEPWRIGIRHPEEKGRAVAWVPLSSGGLASSGDYERCLKVGGRRYGHILNPQTGWPLQGLAAVSVIAGQCLVAGSSSTIAMLKPVSEALDWLAALGLPWLALDQNLHCHGSLKRPA